MKPKLIVLIGSQTNQLIIPLLDSYKIDYDLEEIPGHGLSHIILDRDIRLLPCLIVGDLKYEGYESISCWLNATVKLFEGEEQTYVCTKKDCPKFMPLTSQYGLCDKLAPQCDYINEDPMVLASIQIRVPKT